MRNVVDYLDRELPSLLELLRGSDVRELELQEGEMRLRLTRAPSLQAEENEIAGVDPPTFVPLETVTVEIASPFVGTFYRAGQPGIPPLVAEGSPVTSETVVGFVDVLGEPTEVEAGCSGVIIHAQATDGQIVEYGQVLFEVERSD